MPGSKLPMLGMVISPLIGMVIMGPYKPLRNWVDDHPLLYGNDGSLDNPDVSASLPSVVTWPLTLVVGTNHSRRNKYQTPQDNRIQLSKEEQTDFTMTEKVRRAAT